MAQHGQESLEDVASLNVGSEWSHNSVGEIDELVKRHQTNLRKHLQFLKSFCSNGDDSSGVRNTAQQCIQQTQEMQAMISRLKLDQVQKPESYTKGTAESAEVLASDQKSKKAGKRRVANDMFVIDKKPMTEKELEQRISAPSTPEVRTKKRKLDVDGESPDLENSTGSKKAKAKATALANSNPADFGKEDSFVDEVEARHRTKEVSRLKKADKKRKRESKDSIEGEAVSMNGTTEKRHLQKKSKHDRVLAGGLAERPHSRDGADDSVDGSLDASEVSKQKSSKRRQSEQTTSEQSSKRRKTGTKGSKNRI